MEDLKVPKHIAIIPDGNRRWAKANGMPAIEGHRRGVMAMKEISKACRDKGIHTFTAWGFSSENWSRDIDEVKYLMDLFIKVLEDNEKEAHENQIKFVHLGRKDRLPDKLLNVVKRIEFDTKNYDKYIYNFCLDYGGQDEIIRATNKILQSDKKYDSITKEEFEQYLDTAGQPHPYVDLLIRTSGEQRTSGLLPFQMAYAELYFEQSYLPDFSVQKFEIALQSYANRDRRFGGNTQGHVENK